MYRRSGSRSRSGSRRTQRSGLASRARNSVRAAYQARDSATFAIRSESDIDNSTVSRAYVFARSVIDPQFSAIAALYDQVQLTGVQVKLNVTGVTTGEPGVASSVPMVVAWDRDAQIDETTTYEDIVNYSSARTYQLGNLTAGKIISSSLYPTTMGEKSEMWSTDRIMSYRKGASDNWPSIDEQYTNFIASMDVNAVQWDPVYLIAVPEKAAFSARLTVIATLRCRGVRFQRRWLDTTAVEPDPGDVLEDSPATMCLYTQTVPGGTTGTVQRVRHISGSVLKQAWDLLKRNPVPLKTKAEAYIAASKLTGAANLYLALESDMRHGGKLYATSWRPDFDIDQEPGSVEVANSMLLSEDMVTPLGGILTEGADEAGTAYGLIVDGSKMYDPLSQKIIADGYVDLQPPPDDYSQQSISGINMPVVGWAAVSGKTTEELQEINKTCSLPLVEELSDSGTEQYTVKTAQSYSSGPVHVPVRVTGKLQPWSASDIVEVGFGRQMAQLFTRFGTEIRVGHYANKPFGEPFVEWDEQRQTFGDTTRVVISVGFSSELPTTTLDMVLMVQPVADSVWSAEDAVLFMTFMRSYAVLAVSVLQGTDSIVAGFEAATSDGQVAWVSGSMPTWTDIFNEAFVPVTGKIWSRIKGFFQRVFRVTKKVVPVLAKVATVAGAVIPPPAGTVVMAVGKGITTASTAVSAIAAGFTKNNVQSLQGVVDYENDVFNVAYESVVAPYGATPEDVMGNSSNWVRSAEWTVPVRSAEPTQMNCIGGVVSEVQKQQVQVYLMNNGDAETPLQIQQRIRVHFEKAMTPEQAQNYKARIVFGSSSDFPEVDFHVE